MELDGDRPRFEAVPWRGAADSAEVARAGLRPRSGRRIPHEPRGLAARLAGVRRRALAHDSRPHRPPPRAVLQLADDAPPLVADARRGGGRPGVEGERPSSGALAAGHPRRHARPRQEGGSAARRAPAHGREVDQEPRGGHGEDLPRPLPHLGRLAQPRCDAQPWPRVLVHRAARGRLGGAACPGALGHGIAVKVPSGEKILRRGACVGPHGH
mmetsp:Transcript_76860/g.223168  ORF Transcript_76860/g.223168 Transcript_76860/m.223168 type:complete len:213 (+) Transcript_76860:591-1229(+)